MSKYMFLILLVSFSSYGLEEYSRPKNSNLAYSESKYGGMWDYFVGEELIRSVYVVQRSYDSLDSSGLSVILTPTQEEMERLPAAIKFKPIPPKKIQVKNAGKVAKLLLTDQQLDAALKGREVISGNAEFLISSYASGIECDYREYHITVKSVVEIINVAELGGKKQSVC